MLSSYCYARYRAKPGDKMAKAVRAQSACGSRQAWWITNWQSTNGVQRGGCQSRCSLESWKADRYLLRVRNRNGCSRQKILITRVKARNERMMQSRKCKKLCAGVSLRLGRWEWRGGVGERQIWGSHDRSYQEVHLHLEDSQESD